MSDWITQRKTRRTGFKYQTPKVSISFPRGEFRFYKLATDLMKFNRESQALMFKLNKKDKSVIIDIENKLNDNYHLSDGKGYYRTTSKDLAILFSDVLNLDFEGNYFFSVEKISELSFKMTLDS